MILKITMKITNLLLLVILIDLLSCEKHEEKSPTDASSIEIAGNWEIIRITGGHIGRPWIPDWYKYLYIKPNAEFGFFNDTILLACGIITTEADSNNDLWYKFNVDSTKIEPSVPLPTYLPKRVNLLDSKNLVLADPCCDLNTYIFVKTKRKSEFDW